MPLFRPIGWLVPAASPTRPLLPLLSMLLVAVAPPSGHAQADRPATAVIASDAERQTWSDPLEALGTVRADESVTLSATVTEIIRAVHFDDGQRVAQGDLLVHLEDREEQAELAAARARLVEQRNVLERAVTLCADGSISAADLNMRSPSEATGGPAAVGGKLGEYVAGKNRKRFGIATVNLSLCFPDKSEPAIRRMVFR